MFGISIYVEICYDYLDYRSLSGDYDIVKGSIRQLVHLTASEATVLTRLEQWKKRHGHVQKVYADTLTSDVGVVMNQLIVGACRFVQICERRELELSLKIAGSDSKRDRKQKVFRQPR